MVRRGMLKGHQTRATFGATSCITRATMRHFSLYNSGSPEYACQVPFISEA